MRKLMETIMEEQDDGKGLDPLLKKYVWNKVVDPIKLKKRERAITTYYQEIMRQSKNSNVAYDKTDKWASGIFV